MLFNRTQSVHPLVVAASVAALGIPIPIPGSTPSKHILLSGDIRHRFHSKQYHQYRRACYRLALTAKSLQETVGVLGPLGSPLKLTCGISLSLVQGLEGIVVNRPICAEIAELVTRHLNLIREELHEAAKGDAKFRSLVEDYAETLREVSQGVALIAHKRRLSQLVHHHSQSEELQRFKAKLDTTFQAFMDYCGLQNKQMQGYVNADQLRVVKNQHEHSHILVAVNEQLENVLEKLDQIVENPSNFEQILQTLASCFDDPKVLSNHLPSSDPIDLPEP